LQKFEYNSDLVGGSLMVRESRVIANLLLNNATDEEWHQEIQIENRLQKRSPASAKRNAQAIRKRLEPLESEFWLALRDGDDELATQVCFVSALDRNLLLVEFMEQVVKDLYTVHAEKIERYHWTEFVEDCANKDPKIFDWKESSKNKMGQIVLRMLAEAGYVVSTKSAKLQAVIVRSEIKNMLENSFRQRLLSCMDLRK
jgi:hypothetical protein